MKKSITIIIIALACIALPSACIPTIAYHKYIKASEELLWELEEMCEVHGIYWSDTVCEGDTWCNYNDARKELGLKELVHYSKREE